MKIPQVQWMELNIKIPPKENLITQILSIFHLEIIAFKMLSQQQQQR